MRYSYKKISFNETTKALLSACVHSYILVPFPKFYGFVICLAQL